MHLERAARPGELRDVVAVDEDDRVGPQEELRCLGRRCDHAPRQPERAAGFGTRTGRWGLGRQQRLEATREFAGRSGELGDGPRIDTAHLGAGLLDALVGVVVRRRWRSERRVESGRRRSLTISCVTRFDAQVDEFGAQLGDLVLGLDDIGAESVEFGAQRVDRRLAPGDVRPQSHGHLFCGASPLLLAPQAGAQVGLGSSIGLCGDELLDLRLPPVGSLQPQDADGVDQLGQRAGRDRRAERLVAVDGTSEPSERTPWESAPCPPSIGPRAVPRPAPDVWRSRRPSGRRTRWHCAGGGARSKPDRTYDHDTRPPREQNECS